MKLNDWKFIIILSAVLIILTSAPYLYGRLTAPAGYSTIGLGVHNWVDNSVYYSYIEQVKQGQILFRDLYTTENQIPFFNIFWLALGFLAKILNLSPPAAFHLARILLIPVLVYSLYLFLGLFIKNTLKLKIAAIFLVFISGAGIFFADLLRFLPLKYQFLWDINVPEALIFRSAYASPHFIASWMLLVLSFFFFIRSLENNTKLDIVWAGICAAVLAQFHPFYVLSLVTIPTAFIFFSFLKEHDKKLLKYWLIFESFLIPPTLYYVYLQRDLVFYARSENLMPSPAPVTLLFSFGLLILLAVAGIFFAIKKNRRAWVFLVIWFFANTLLLYAPVAFQRRLIEGWMIPTGLLALLTLNKFLKSKMLANYFKHRIIYSLLIFFFALQFFFSNLFVWQMSFDFYQTKAPPVYLPRQELLAFDWVRQYTKKGEIILANNFIDANILPGLTGRHIFFGHGFETVNFNRKTRATEDFLNNDDPLKQYDFLKNNSINFIFWNSLYSNDFTFNSQRLPFLKEVFRNEAVRIYAVN